MPFREKLRKKFSRGSSTSTSSETSSTLGDDNSPKFLYYQPGERIPYKYRRPVEKAHKDKLESYSFATAWNSGRKSCCSQYSPMGSKMPSRRNSVELQMAKREFHMTRVDSGHPTEGAYEGDSPINAGFSSRCQSTALSTSQASAFSTPTYGTDLPQPSTRPRNNTLFNPEDLTLALQKTRMSS